MKKLFSLMLLFSLSLAAFSFTSPENRLSIPDKANIEKNVSVEHNMAIEFPVKKKIAVDGFNTNYITYHSMVARADGAFNVYNLNNSFENLGNSLGNSSITLNTHNFTSLFINSRYKQIRCNTGNINLLYLSKNYHLHKLLNRPAVKLLNRYIDRS